MQDYLNALEQIPAELRNPLVELTEAIEKRMRTEFAVRRQDLIRLESIVAELAQDQKETRAELKETAQIVGELAVETKELRAAQAETAQIVGELAIETKELRAAQAETAQIVSELAVETKELRAAQAETAQIVGELAVETKELRAAQAETAQIVSELAEAQKQHASHMLKLDRTMHAVGARWGIQSETSFREALSGILGDLGFEVDRYVRQDEEGTVHGHPAQVELDVVIQDGKLILIEIKSSMSRSEVYTFERVVTFYEAHENRRVDRKLVVCPFLKPGAIEAAARLGIEVFTDVSEVF